MTKKNNDVSIQEKIKKLQEKVENIVTNAEKSSDTMLHDDQDGIIKILADIIKMDINKFKEKINATYKKITTSGVFQITLNELDKCHNSQLRDTTYAIEGVKVAYNTLKSKFSYFKVEMNDNSTIIRYSENDIETYLDVMLGCYFDASQSKNEGLKNIFIEKLADEFFDFLTKNTQRAKQIKNKINEKFKKLLSGNSNNNSAYIINFYSELMNSFIKKQLVITLANTPILSNEDSSYFNPFLILFEGEDNKEIKLRYRNVIDLYGAVNEYLSLKHNLNVDSFNDDKINPNIQYKSKIKEALFQDKEGNAEERLEKIKGIYTEHSKNKNESRANCNSNELKLLLLQENINQLIIKLNDLGDNSILNDIKEKFYSSSKEIKTYLDSYIKNNPDIIFYMYKDKVVSLYKERLDQLFNEYFLFEVILPVIRQLIQEQFDKYKQYKDNDLIQLFIRQLTSPDPLLLSFQQKLFSIFDAGWLAILEKIGNKKEFKTLCEKIEFLSQSKDIFSVADLGIELSQILTSINQILEIKHQEKHQKYSSDLTQYQANSSEKEAIDNLLSELALSIPFTHIPTKEGLSFRIEKLDCMTNKIKEVVLGKSMREAWAKLLEISILDENKHPKNTDVIDSEIKKKLSSHNIHLSNDSKDIEALIPQEYKKDNKLDLSLLYQNFQNEYERWNGEIYQDLDNQNALNEEYEQLTSVFYSILNQLNSPKDIKTVLQADARANTQETVAKADVSANVESNIKFNDIIKLNNFIKLLNFKNKNDLSSHEKWLNDFKELYEKNQTDRFTIEPSNLNSMLENAKLLVINHYNEISARADELVIGKEIFDKTYTNTIGNILNPDQRGEYIKVHKDLEAKCSLKEKERFNKEQNNSLNSLTKAIKNCEEIQKEVNVKTQAIQSFEHEQVIQKLETLNGGTLNRIRKKLLEDVGRLSVESAGNLKSNLQNKLNEMENKLAGLPLFYDIEKEAKEKNVDEQLPIYSSLQGEQTSGLNQLEALSATLENNIKNLTALKAKLESETTVTVQDICDLNISEVIQDNHVEFPPELKVTSTRLASYATQVEKGKTLAGELEDIEARVKKAEAIIKAHTAKTAAIETQFKALESAIQGLDLKVEGNPLFKALESAIQGLDLRVEVNPLEEQEKLKGDLIEKLKAKKIALLNFNEQHREALLSELDSGKRVDDVDSSFQDLSAEQKHWPILMTDIQQALARVDIKAQLDLFDKIEEEVYQKYVRIFARLSLLGTHYVSKDNLITLGFEGILDIDSNRVILSEVLVACETKIKAIQKIIQGNRKQLREEENKRASAIKNEFNSYLKAPNQYNTAESIGGIEAIRGNSQAYLARMRTALSEIAPGSTQAYIEGRMGHLRGLDSRSDLTALSLYQKKLQKFESKFNAMKKDTYLDNSNITELGLVNLVEDEEFKNNYSLPDDTPNQCIVSADKLKAVIGSSFESRQGAYTVSDALSLVNDAIQVRQQQRRADILASCGIRPHSENIAEPVPGEQDEIVEVPDAVYPSMDKVLNKTALRAYIKDLPDNTPVDLAEFGLKATEDLGLRLNASEKPSVGTIKSAFNPSFPVAERLSSQARTAVKVIDTKTTSLAQKLQQLPEVAKKRPPSLWISFTNMVAQSGANIIATLGGIVAGALLGGLLGTLALGGPHGTIAGAVVGAGLGGFFGTGVRVGSKNYIDGRLIDEEKARLCDNRDRYQDIFLPKPGSVK